MTERKQALQELRDKVAERGFSFCHADSVLGYQNGHHAMNAFYGSLDAAKALHEAVLPGWVNVDIKWVSTRIVSIGSVEMSDGRSVSKSESNDPSRAWLLCILDALIAEADNG